MPKVKRRESREIAFALLFEWSFREEEILEEIVEQAERCRDVHVDDFARALAGKAIDYRIQLDALIERHSDRWKLNRLSRVTLAVLRMAICELSQMADIPAGATINEAVELMKKYATADEAAYVNGVLGAYNRALEAERGEGPQAGPASEEAEKVGEPQAGPASEEVEKVGEPQAEPASKEAEKVGEPQAGPVPEEDASAPGS